MITSKRRSNGYTIDPSQRSDNCTSKFKRQEEGSNRQETLMLSACWFESGDETWAAGTKEDSKLLQAARANANRLLRHLRGLRGAKRKKELM